MQHQQFNYISSYPVASMEKHRAAMSVGKVVGAAVVAQSGFTNFDTMDKATSLLFQQQKHAQDQQKQQQQHIEQSTRSLCPERPCYVVPNHFFAGQSNFQTIKASIDVALMKLKMMDKYQDCLDFAYFPIISQWRMKYVNGSEMREIHVNCYWDTNSADHIIEVNRVKGDGISSCVSDIFEAVRKAVLGERYIAPKLAPGRRPMMGGLPPLKRLAGAVVTKVEEDKFLKGVKATVSMAESNFFEPRLEAGKALCELAQRDANMLCLPECQSQVVRAINSLLMDEFEDVHQFAVIACSRFAAVSASYKVALSEMNAVNGLVRLVVESVSNDQLAYETAQMRRKACVSLGEMIKECPEKIRSCFEEHGVHDMQTLQQRINGQIADMVVADLELCFMF
jgi:hypothetical protein